MCIVYTGTHMFNVTTVEMDVQNTYAQTEAQNTNTDNYRVFLS